MYRPQSLPFRNRNFQTVPCSAVSGSLFPVSSGLWFLDYSGLLTLVFPGLSFLVFPGLSSALYFPHFELLAQFPGSYPQFRA